MVITPHLLAGAAIGAHSPNVWVAFCFGLISHYLLDSLPHWDYLDSVKISKFSQIAKISIDLIIGLIILITLSWPLKIIVISGIIGALLPDFLQLVYGNVNIKFLRPFCLFHNKIHYYKRVSFLKGSIFQVIVIILSVILLYLS